ncbi:tetratricopeptide repeat protein [Pseudonocardia bannensis]|uniref:Helix-turn-helix transcriptional regulator n=1 Tax=Pseudonocardia bannensis TaxID=630973 RepID=A0A848DH06_9PSEU|nr:helix-turn-helix transcriptional regulator [Pseudonocardia bannensis]NMH91804.1 helix-turn-helix transcriptional regulator [Pseudonocardia bannensis]
MSTEQDAGPGAALRAARLEKSWSQADAARELAALGRVRGAPTAAPASLKTQLSRWENGHSLPEPPYRRLLAELYGRAEVSFGFEPTTPAGEGDDAGPAGRLRTLLDEADAVDEAAVSLLRAQLVATRRLDVRLGAAGTADTVRAQVEQLDRLLVHTTAAPRRRAVAAVLAEAALLAGWQALDRDRPDEAWAQHDRARAAAREAEEPDLLAQSLAGLAAVLVELGRTGAAAELLDPAQDEPGTAWTAAALGRARAAAGDLAGSRRAFDAAERAARTSGAATPDVVRPGLALDYDGVHRWRCAALAGLGDSAAITQLDEVVAGGAGPVRERAALQAELAIALAAHGEAAEAAEHARSARLLAERIGSRRVHSRLDRAATGPA